MNNYSAQSIHTCPESSTGVVLVVLTAAIRLTPERSSSGRKRAKKIEMRPHSTVFWALLSRRSRLLHIRSAMFVANFCVQKLRM